MFNHYINTRWQVWSCMMALLCLPLWMWAQNGAPVWTSIEEAKIPQVGTRYIQPTAYQTFQLNTTALEAALAKAPMTKTAAVREKPAFVEIPWPDGQIKTFQIIESPIMESELAAQYPNIKTYAGSEVGDPTNYIRLDWTPKGFHAIILTAGKGTVYVDPYSFGGGDIEHYIVYYKHNFSPIAGKQMVCGVDGSAVDTKDFRPRGSNSRFGSCELRTYRLALAATGEYTQFHGGTVADALAAQVVSMNRVNAIYIRDISIQMNIINNNNLIIYTNGATDPYTNNSGATMLGENQANVDAVIGSANYDIGHVYSTGGGGIARLFSPCSAGNKARGVTGSPAPVGDPFDVDYVCHEIGHQFGANHTQNNSCNRNANTAVEPGSASTIMGYAGICAPNVQNNSDDHFHGISLDEIGSFITSGAHTCPVKTPLSNSAPTVTGTNAAGVTIPANTPFALTAIATDPNASNTLTYCWEQMDNGVATMPPTGASTNGPNFRSFSPTTNPTRHFPNLTALSSGATTTWEVLPTVSRSMNFRVTVRDNATGGGCTDHNDVVVNVTDNAGPFIVNYPSATGISWNGATTETVTWSVANTDVAPVSCANVDILLSTDGGQTYPTVLASNVPNDGSHPITVPNVATTTARVMVICANGTFFDISNNNFTIVQANNDYTISTNNNTATACQPNNATYSINIGQIGNFNNPVNLSVSGVPAGANASFSANPVTPTATSILTISNTGAATAGAYNLTVTANSTSGTKTLALTLNIAGVPGNVSLSAPANGATGVAVPTSFTWTGSGTAGEQYNIQIATDAGFNTIIDNANGLTSPAYSSTGLSLGTTYFWRVQATNPCGSGAFSSTRTFTTGSCATFASSNVPVAISASGTPTVTSNLPINLTGAIADVNVLGVSGTHTWINDLDVSLTSPAGTNVSLWSRICNDEDDFDVNFDDAAASATLPCPPTGGGTFQPAGSLASLNGENPSGTWTLTITDNVNQDGGQLNAWALEVCLATNNNCTVSATSNNASCNGASDGSATATGTGTAPITYAWSTGASTATVTGLGAGVYNVTATDASFCTAITSVTITEPAAIVLTPSATAETCAGNDGTAAVAATGGAGGFTFLWSSNAGSATTTSVANLSAGVYSVTVTDLNNCSQVVNINVPNGCNGGTTGCDTISNYNFATHTVRLYRTGTVHYVSGHNQFGDISKADFYNYGGSNTHIQGAYLGVGASIASNATNTFNITVWDGTGGTPGAILATMPVTYQSMADSLAVGNNLIYFPLNNVLLPASKQFFLGVEFTYGNDSIALLTNTVGETTPATAWEQWSDNSWHPYDDPNGWNIGVAHLIVPVLGTEPTAAFNSSSNAVCASSTVTFTNNSLQAQDYQWFFPGGTPATSSAVNPTVTYNSAGTYDVMLIANNDCISDTLMMSNAIQVNSVTANSSSTDIACFGNNTGTATVNPLGGLAPYSYQWSANANGQTTATVTGLAAGTYTATLTDANGCSATTTAVVNTPTTPLSASVSNTTNVACNGGNSGSITVSASGGTAGYTYNIGQGNQASNTFTGLGAGSYTITITDANGCTQTTSATLTAPTALNASAAQGAAISCANTTDGSAVASANGGTAPYTYLWSANANNQTTATASNLGAGTYQVVITDANGCTNTASITLTAPAAFGASASVSNAVSCANSTDGSATASANGGTAPYTYLWSTNANSQTTATASNLAAGTYQVTITDANGCSNTTSVSLTAPNSVNANTAAGAAISCSGSVDGSATASANGGTAPYTYLWSANANNQTTATANNLGAGTYTVTITDANGCTDNSSIVITEPTPVSVVAAATSNYNGVNVSCSNATDGSTQATVTGGTAPYTYLWTPSGQTTATANNLAAGNYTVIVTDANGCVETGAATLTAPTALTANASDNGNGSATVTATGGSPSYTYQWDATANNQTTATASNLMNGTYQVTVTDANGCTVVTSVQVIVTSVPAIGDSPAFAVYPNPNNGNFQISGTVAQPEATTITVYNALGQTLVEFQPSSTNFEIPVNISEQASGVYLVRLQTAGYEVSRKVICRK